MQRIALVCTHGFADVLTLGRQNRADPYALHVGESPWVAALPDAWRVQCPGASAPTGRKQRRWTCPRCGPA
jgi:N-methylhydantoinase B